MEFLFKLILGHVVGDFVFQGDAMAQRKSRHNKHNEWFYWLTSHALVHGGIVWFVTGSLALGAVEIVLHWAIDFMKCEGMTNLHQDQMLHLLCKVIYLVFLLN